ncbi:MAG: hypothetical protein JXQ84_07045, partial [Rhodospirillaceae bacterium]|nr:hypothetical protein [Rhodospirillaceae bacterium]
MNRKALTQRQRFVLFAICGVVVLGVGTSVWLGQRRGGGNGVRWQAVVRDSVERTVTATGALKPKTYVDVGTQVSGQLRHIYAAIGDR